MNTRVLRRLPALWMLTVCLICVGTGGRVYAESTALHGGAGGKYYSRQCPPGQFLVGINGHIGLYVDAISPVCATVAGNSWRNLNQIAPFGDFDRVPTPAPRASGEQLNCATDRLVSAITVTTNTPGNFVSSVRSHCSRINGSGSRVDGPALIGDGPRLNERRLSCPRGQFGKGFSGRSGEFVDSIRLDCIPISGAYAQDTLMEAGGAGGTPAVSACPSNQRMIGLISRVERGPFGTWIKGLRPVCAAMPDWQLAIIPALMQTGRIADQARLARNVGAGGGDSSRLLCPAGQYVEAVETHYERFLHGVKLRCRTMTYSQMGASSFAGRAEGKREYLACPGDMVAAGVVVRAGSAIDALRLRCKRDSNPGTKLLAIVGDSFSAGEGAPDIKVQGNPLPQNEGPGSRTNRSGWVDRPCHRSNKAGTTLAARQLVKETNGQVVYRNFSCSGARVGEGLVGHQSKTSENGSVIDPQLQTATEWGRSRNRRVDTLLVSIGGNDAGFGSRISDCAITELVEDYTLGVAAGSCGNDAAYLDTIRTALRELAGELQPLAAELPNTVRPTRVFLRTYPDPMRNSNGFCANFADTGPRPGGGLVERTLYDGLEGFTEETSRLVYNEFIVPLSRTMNTVARNNGWAVINGWDQATRGRGFCAPARQRYFNTPSDTHRDQGNFNGVFHPNAAGYAAEAPLIVNALLPVMRGTAAPRNTVARPTRPVVNASRQSAAARARATAPSKAARAKAPAVKTLSNKALQQAVDQYLKLQNRRSRVQQRALWDARAKPRYSRVRTGYLVDTDVLAGKARVRTRFSVDNNGRVTRHQPLVAKK